MPGLTPDEAAEWLRKVPPEVLSGELVPYDLAGDRPRYLVEWPAGLPHDPMWNLIPRNNRPQAVPWECDWHGTVDGERCEECHREHGEYLERGTWADRRPVPPPEELAVADRLTALSDELGLYDDGPDCG